MNEQTDERQASAVQVQRPVRPLLERLRDVERDGMTFAGEAANAIEDLSSQLDQAINDADCAIEHARRVDAKERDAMAAAIQHALHWMEAAGFDDVPAAQQLRAAIGSRLAESAMRRARVVGA